MTDVAGLSLEEVRGVVDAVADSESDHQVRGAAQWPLSPDLARDPSTTSVERVDRLLARHGWQVHTGSPHRRTLASALDTLDELEFAATDEVLDAYAEALESIAEIEVARVAAEAEPVVAAERPRGRHVALRTGTSHPAPDGPRSGIRTTMTGVAALPLYCGLTSRTPVSAWRSAAMATSNQRPITGEAAGGLGPSRLVEVVELVGHPLEDVVRIGRAP